jgi:phenylalanyl-tRNA synthetase alpha chain
LNFPPEHPVRDSQDTLMVDRKAASPLLLRTHTSPVQVREMKKRGAPLRILVPGRVYRKDEVDATHSPVFHQAEALVVDRGISMADLKGTVAAFLEALFGRGTRTRFIPTFFPFVEPGVDVAMSCIFCKGSGCRKCKESGWIEIMGAGMVHPLVLRGVGIDPEEYSGFALGLGLDRVALLLYGFPDLRLLFEGDERFLAQFANE